jgi:hypothetical protein
MSKWTFVVADLTTAVNVAQLENVKDAQLTFSLNAPTQLSFTLPLDSPYADYVLAGNCLLKAYQSIDDGPQILRAVTEVVTAEEIATAEGMRSLAILAMCAGSFRLARRIVGKKRLGFTQSVARDRGLIASDLINAVNKTASGSLPDAGGMTGVRVGSITASSTTTLDPGLQFTPVLDAISNLSKDLDGFDWQMIPVDGIAQAASGDFASAVIIGEFVAAPVYGTARDLVFQYGSAGANVSEYHRQLSRANLANVVYVLPQDWGTVVSSTSAVAVGLPQGASSAVTGAGRYEALFSDAVSSTALRSSLAQTLATIRSDAQQLLTFTPLPNVAEYGRDYGPGDTVLFQSKMGSAVRLNSTVRIYNIALSIDDLGRETASLTLTPESI